MSSSSRPTPAGATTDDPWWKSTWPLGRRQWGQLAVALIGVIAVFVVVGLLLTEWGAPNAITDLDEDWAQRLADGRTEFRNDLSTWGSLLADTPVKIGLTAALFAGMLYRWRRWHEALFVALTLIFEASAYAISSTIIGRPRPDVERLGSSPVDTSFPSGHVAAATVYISLAVILFWHVKARWARMLSVAVVTLLPVAVAISRLYKGMHFLSDVVAGVFLGLISVWICLQILGRPADAIESSPGPERTLGTERKVADTGHVEVLR